MSTLQEYQHNGTEDSYAPFTSDNPAWSHGWGQNFTPTSSYVIGSFKFINRKTNTDATDLVYAGRLYATSAGLPTGSALATTDSLNVSDLPTTMTEIEYTFITPYQLTSGVEYAVVMEYISGTPANPQHAFVRGSTSDEYASHDAIIKSAADVWADYFGGRDLWFEIYSVIPSSVKKVSGVARASIKKIGGVALASISKVNGVSCPSS